MASAHPSLSVVIATRNRAPLLRLCLGAVAQQEVPRESFEVVVVNNASEDDTPAVAEQEASRHGFDLCLVHEPRIGLAVARNRGAAEAAGEGIVFLDDDALPRPGWLSAFRRRLIDERRSLVQGRIVARFAGGRPKWIGDRQVSRFGAYAQTRETPVESFHGGNMGVTADVFRRVGGFREELGLGATGLGEDTDFARRAIDAGVGSVYEAQAVVDHLIARRRATRGDLLRRCYRSGLSQPLFQSYTASLPRTIAGFVWHSSLRLCASAFAGTPSEQMDLTCDVVEHAGRVIQILRQSANQTMSDER